jgi:lysozyme
MRTSEQGRKLITQFEGEILKVYLDPVGLPTVGVGHLVKPNEKDVYPLGKKITKAESQDLLSKDLARFEGSINSLVKVPLTQNQFDALVSLVFNIGTSAFQNSSVLRRLNEKNYQAAADAFLMWVKSQGKVLRGLQNRRRAERALFLRPDDAKAKSRKASGTVLLASIGTMSYGFSSGQYVLLAVGLIVLVAVGYFLLRK